MSSLLDAVVSGSILAVEASLAEEKITDLHGHNNKGQNVLEIAIESGDIRIVERIVRKLQETDDLYSLLKTDTPFQPSKPDPWYIKWIPQPFNPKSTSWYSKWIPQLLKKREPSPIPLINAARIKNPQLYNFLLKQYPGYINAVTEEAKKERLRILAIERRWGLAGAILKSLCPSKASADVINIPEILTGFGVAVGLGVMSVITIPAAIISVIGLYFLGTANYRKIKAEQSIEDNNLNTTILFSKLNNFQAKIARYRHVTRSPEERALLQQELDNLLEEIKNIKIKTIKPPKFTLLWRIIGFLNIKRLILKFRQKKDPKHIKIAPLGSKKTNQDFLSSKDETYTNRSLKGDILCTNAGFFGITGLILAVAGVSTGTPFIIAAIITLLIACVSTYLYFKNKPQLNKEVAEQRRLQSDNQQKLLKGVKNFIKNKDELTSILSLLEYSEEDKSRLTLKVKSIQLSSPDNKKIKEANRAAYASLSMANADPFYRATLSGDREWLKYLINAGQHPIPNKDTKDAQDKTLLHLAAEKGNLLFIEKMLGVGISDKSRDNKTNWLNFKFNQDKNDRYQELTDNVKEMLTTPDKQGLLPLDYAAQLSDRSVYDLFLSSKSLAVYSRDQLDRAKDLRNNPINQERSKAKIMAAQASICPMSSPTEILTSLTFNALTLSTLAVGLSLFGLSLLIFAGVCTANYFKGLRERGIIDGLEQASRDLAYATIIQQQLEQSVVFEPNDLQEKQEFINTIKKNPRLVERNKITKLSDFLTTGDRAVVWGSTIGSFLCSFAGILSLAEMVFALSGPLGWGFLLASSAVVALGLASIYCYNSIHDLKTVIDLRQQVYQKQEDLENIVFSKKMKALFEPPAPPETPTRKLSIDLPPEHFNSPLQAPIPTFVAEGITKSISC